MRSISVRPSATSPASTILAEARRSVDITGAAVSLPTPLMMAVFPSSRISAPMRRISSMCMKRFSKIVSMMVPTPLATVLSAANCACMSVGNAGDGACDEVRAALDTIGQDFVGRAVEALHAFDDDSVGAGALDLRAHRAEEIRQVDHFGLARGVLQHGLTLGQCGGHHEVFGAGDGDGLQHQTRPLEAVRASLDIAVL